MTLKEKIIGLFSSSSRKRHSLVGSKRLWKMKRDFQINFLKQAGLLPGHRLMDIGCGTLRGGTPLIEYLDAGNYCGLEARENVLAEAKLELRDSGLERKRPTLVHSPRLAEINLGKSFDYIWAFSVLIHMNDQILDQCLQLAGKHLSAEGRFYGNANFGDRSDGSWQGFPVVFRSIDFYREAASRHQLKVEEVGTLGSLGHNSGVELQDQGRMLKFTRS
ncbi:MAG: class I SAM-dependent methyltransferase [Verrucomicrobiota bacterium]